MLTTVIKRDGRIVDFNSENIKSAISFAMQRTEKGIDQSIINKIVEYVENKNVDQLSVEEIHNIIEKRLMSSSRKDAAKEYVKERHRRDVARQSKAKVMFDEIVSTKANDITRENANMNADTPAGMMMKFASETTKTFVDNYLLSDDVKELVSNNIMHVHDKDYYPTKSLTCIQHPLDKIFENGFRAGHGEARPPKRIESASILACISMETVQNEMHGGQAIPAFDFYLAPFVRLTLKEELKKLSDATGKDLNQYGDIELKDYIKKDLTDLEGTERYIQSAINQTVSRVHQALESLVHNLNTIHSRGGNQVVFSSINYGTDTSAEGRCIIREILNTTYEGVGNGSTAIFPIQIWKLKKGVSYLPTDPNYDLYKFACKVSARRFFPNFLNLDATYNQDPLWNENDPKRYIHEVATMGCVDGEEVITYKKNDEIITTSFKRMWNDMSSIFPIESQENLGYEEGEYIDLNGIEIFDKDGFVKCYRIIKNPDKGDWYKVTLTNGRSLLCTSDHPWSIINDGKESVIQTKDLSDGDVVCVTSEKKKSVYINQDYNSIKFDNSVISKIEFIGNRDSNSFDVTTESEHFIVSGIRSHNCRTRVYGNRFGEYPTSIGRGNLSFTTLNLPKIAIEAALSTGSLFENADGKIVSIFDESVDTVSDDLKKDITDKTLEIFFADLSKYLDVVAKQLDERYKFQATAKVKQFPLLMGGLWNGSEKLNPDDTIESVIKEGTLGIGFIGLAEALVALTGKHHGESDESQKLGLRIIGLINDKAKEYSDKYDHNYSCFATPAEGLSGKFTKVDKKEFGIIKGITDKDYYTNSNHVPVWYKCSAKHKAEIEGPYHEITPAGHIFYVEMDGELEKNPEAIMNIVDLMYKYNIGYGSVNHNVARCEDCGHESVKEFEKNENGELCCPICGSTYVTHLQRITGYLVGTIDRWNSGKQAEWRDRVNHKI